MPSRVLGTGYCTLRLCRDSCLPVGRVRLTNFFSPEYSGSKNLSLTKNPSQKYEKIDLLLKMERAGIGNQELSHIFSWKSIFFLLPLLFY